MADVDHRGTATVKDITSRYSSSVRGDNDLVGVAYTLLIGSRLYEEPITKRTDDAFGITAETATGYRRRALINGLGAALVANVALVFTSNCHLDIVLHFV